MSPKAWRSGRDSSGIVQWHHRAVFANCGLKPLAEILGIELEIIAAGIPRQCRY
jgi:hypothetical protein